MATPLRSCGAYRLCGGIPLRKPPRRLASRPNRTAFGRPSFDCVPVVDCVPGDRLRSGWPPDIRVTNGAPGSRL